MPCALCAQLPGVHGPDSVGQLPADGAGRAPGARAHHRHHRVPLHAGEHHVPDGGRGRPAVRAPQVDPLLRERDLDHVPGGAERVRPGPRRVGQREPHGGEQGPLPHHHHLPLVPELLGHSLPQQEGSAGGKDYALTFGRLFSRV